MKLGIVSDLHWAVREPPPSAWHNPFDFAGVPGRVAAAAAAFAEAGVDAVVVCGDVANGGDEASMRAALGSLTGPWPVYAVAGNHDCEERDDRLERCAEVLGAAGADIGGVRVAGVAIARAHEPGAFVWSDAPDGAAVVVSHFPVLPLAGRLAEHGLRHPGDLGNRAELQERLSGGPPVVALTGHVHARASDAAGSILQLSMGSVIEPPYDLAFLEVDVAGPEVRVRRRALDGPPAVNGVPVLAPDDESWTFGPSGWRAVRDAA